MAATLRGVYRRRHPEGTPLYAVVNENLESFLDEYDHRLFERFGPLTDEARRALRDYTTCGVLQYGFARIRCDCCGEERLLAFSCQRRGFFPSCMQKRVEQFARFCLDEVVEDVAHRQFVFVVPRLVRPTLHKDGAMIGLLCRTMQQSLVEFYATGLGRPHARPGAICSVQRFGDRVNPHIHLHVLSTDGAFDEEGFHRLPLGREDVEYLGRGPIANDRLEYDAERGRVSVRSSKRRGGRRETVAVYDAHEFLALLCQQVPPPGCHLIRYYGWYSVRSRAKRRSEAADEGARPAIGLTAEPPSARARRKRWAELLRLVFEIDPLTCPTCGGEMRIVSFITLSQPEVITRRRPCGYRLCAPALDRPPALGAGPDGSAVPAQTPGGLTRRRAHPARPARQLRHHRHRRRP